MCLTDGKYTILTLLPNLTNLNLLSISSPQRKDILKRHLSLHCSFPPPSYTLSLTLSQETESNLVNELIFPAIDDHHKSWACTPHFCHYYEALCQASGLWRKERVPSFVIYPKVCCFCFSGRLLQLTVTLQSLLGFGIPEGSCMSGGWGDGREGPQAVVKLSGMPSCLRSITWHSSSGRSHGQG